MYNHSVCTRKCTGRNKKALAFDFNNADAAVCFNLLVRMIAKSRNFDSYLLGGFKYCGSAFNFGNNTVDCNFNHFSSLLAIALSNTSGKFLTAVTIGVGEVWPNPQREASIIVEARSFIVSMSLGVAV